MSRDWEANKSFFCQVFGWQINDMSGEGFDYATFVVEGRDVGGIGGLWDEQPAEVPAHWRTYFHVVDVDAATVAVESLGGTVLQPPWDTPFGRMAAVQDNQEAVLMLMSPPA